MCLLFKSNKLFQFRVHVCTLFCFVHLLAHTPFIKCKHRRHCCDCSLRQDFGILFERIHTVIKKNQKNRFYLEFLPFSSGVSFVHMNTFFVGAEVDALASAHFRYRVKIRGTDLWEGAFCDARDADRHAESCATKQPTFVRHGVSASSTRTPNSETLNDALHDVGCLREIKCSIPLRLGPGMNEGKRGGNPRATEVSCAQSASALGVTTHAPDESPNRASASTHID